MNNTEREIQQLQTEIDQQKLKVKEAIKNGAMFEEVKKITLYIKQLEKKLASYLANPNGKKPTHCFQLRVSKLHFNT